MECDGIGPDRAESIAEWFADDEAVGSSRSCGRSACGSRPGRRMKPPEGPLTDQTYVITGTLEACHASRRRPSSRRAARR